MKRKFIFLLIVIMILMSTSCGIVDLDWVEITRISIDDAQQLFLVAKSSDSTENTLYKRTSTDSIEEVKFYIESEDTENPTEEDFTDSVNVLNAMNINATYAFIEIAFIDLDQPDYSYIVNKTDGTTQRILLFGRIKTQDYFENYKNIPCQVGSNNDIYFMINDENTGETSVKELDISIIDEPEIMDVSSNTDINEKKVSSLRVNANGDIAFYNNTDNGQLYIKSYLNDGAGRRDNVYAYWIKDNLVYTLEDDDAGTAFDIESTEFSNPSSSNGYANSLNFEIAYEDNFLIDFADRMIILNDADSVKRAYEVYNSSTSTAIEITDMLPTFDLIRDVVNNSTHYYVAGRSDPDTNVLVKIPADSSTSETINATNGYAVLDMVLLDDNTILMSAERISDNTMVIAELDLTNDTLTEIDETLNKTISQITPLN